MKGLNTEDSWNFFIEKIQHCIDHFVPLRGTCKTFKKPKWMDHYCVGKVKKKYQAWKRFTFSHSYTDYESYCKIRQCDQSSKVCKKEVPKGTGS